MKNDFVSSLSGFVDENDFDALSTQMFSQQMFS